MNKLKAANTAAKLVKQASIAAAVPAIATSVDLELILMQQALNSISQGVLITDAQRRTIYVNDAFAQMTGYAKSEIIGGSCAMLQGVGSNPETVNAMRTSLEAGQSFHTHRIIGQPTYVKQHIQTMKLINI
jgi:PAS domain-containing protein